MHMVTVMSRTARPAGQEAQLAASGHALCEWTLQLAAIQIEAVPLAIGFDALSDVGYEFVKSVTMVPKGYVMTKYDHRVTMISWLRLTARLQAANV